MGLLFEDEGFRALNRKTRRNHNMQADCTVVSLFMELQNIWRRQATYNSRRRAPRRKHTAWRDEGAVWKKLIQHLIRLPPLSTDA
jgi:hypothetical protein